MTRVPADSTSQKNFQLWLGMERPQKNTFVDVLPREVVDPVLRLAWTHLMTAKNRDVGQGDFEYSEGQRGC